MTDRHPDSGKFVPADPGSFSSKMQQQIPASQLQSVQGSAVPVSDASLEEQAATQRLQAAAQQAIDATRPDQQIGTTP
jgi:hypothetical protein